MLIMLPAVMIIAAVAGVVYTGHAMEKAKKALARVERRKEKAYSELEEVLKQRESANGTANLLSGVKKELQERKHQLEEQMAELEEEMLPDVKTKGPEHKPLDFEEPAD